ncbi:MAG: type III-B CRISPR-associated protein Cas10/Cmr2, partial [Thermoproteus sp.]
AKTQDAKLLKEIAEDYRAGKLSRNLPYDLERAYPPDTKCQDEEACLEAAKAVFTYVAERNVKSGAQTSPTDLLKLLTNLKDEEHGGEGPRKAEEKPQWKTADLWKNAVELLKALREWA